MTVELIGRDIIVRPGITAIIQTSRPDSRSYWQTTVTAPGLPDWDGHYEETATTLTAGETHDSLVAAVRQALDNIPVLRIVP